MGALKGAVCVVLGGIALVATYVAGSLLGWFLAILSVVGTVVLVVGGLVTLMAYGIWELWQEFKEGRRM